MEKTKKYSCPFHYIGGKSKLLSEILPLIDSSNPEWVIDLFAGGFSVGLNCKCDTIICNDKNDRFVDLLRWLYSESKDFVLAKIDSEITKRDLSKVNKSAYTQLKKDYNKNNSPLLLFLLISFSFNHQMRFNSKGEFNTPFGNNRSSYNEKTRESLSFFMDKIHEKNISFFSKDFSKIQVTNNKGLVFVDPPYLLSTGSYNDGNRGVVSWDENDEKRLYDYLKALDCHGVKFILTNFIKVGREENTILKRFCADYKTVLLESDYSNSNYQKKRTKQQEILVRNF